jgi:hypothetical protein
MNEYLLDPKFIMLAGVVILVIAVVVWLFLQKRRSATADQRQKFGPEYERAIQKHSQNEKQT